MTGLMTYSEWQAGCTSGSLPAYAICYHERSLCVLESGRPHVPLPGSQPVLCLDRSVFRQLFGEETHQLPILQRLGKLIDQHYTTQAHPGWYARTLGVGLWKLNAWSRQACGSNVAGLLLRRAMGEAKQLLAGSTLSVKEISYRVGMDDPSNFAKRFRRITGQTPSAYRDLYHPRK